MITIALTPLKTLLKAVARTARNQTARLGTGWHSQALLDAARKQASSGMRCIGKPFAGLAVLLDSCLRDCATNADSPTIETFESGTGKKGSY